MTFSNGYLGTQGSNTNQANNIKKLSTLGIARVSFSQSYAGTFGGTQGNDLSGVIKLYLNSGSIISLNGAINWRETTGSTVEVFGLIFDPGQNATITYGANQTFNIIGGSTSNSSSTIGLRTYASAFSFTDGENRSGNAATSGLVSALNSELSGTPQPSTITLTNTSVIESQNLVYTVTLSSATLSGRPQVYTFSTSGPAIKGTDYNGTYSFSNGVTDNGDGTITVPAGVSSFTITISTIDDVVVENIENLMLSVGSKFALGSIADNDNLNISNCDPNSLYDNIVSSYHQSIARKSDGSFAVWGNLMGNNGTTNILSPQTINSTNYPALTGTILKTAVAGAASSANSQAILLSTDGLYAWGSAGNILATSLTSNLDAFAKIGTPIGGDANTKLPTGVTPGSVKMMVAFYQTLVLVTNTGNVWVLTQTNGELRGTGTTTGASTTWNKVKIDANTDLTNVITVRGMIDDANYNGLMALTSDGKAYVWGKTVYLGDGSNAVSKSFATQMTLPTEFNENNLPKMIAVTGGNKSNPATCKNTFYILSNGGNLYAVGDNQKRQIGDFTTTERKSWVRVKINATTDFTNVNYISAMESDPSDPAVVIITKAGVLYTWGFNPRNMIGRPTSDISYDPGVPAGFLQGTDKAIFAEMGGHTLVYIKEGSTQFCYVGHRINGSMGDGTTTDADEVAFNCSGTPSLAVCGSVPVTASTSTSTITASPTSIAANGITTSVITVQLKQANGTNLTSTGGTVVITTNKGSISSVTDNNNGTYTAILTSSTFVETATLNYTLNGSNGTNTAAVNFTAATNPVITTTGSLSTFTSCSGCTVTPQSFTVSGVDLSTNNIVVTAPAGVQVSTTINSGFASTISLTPSSGTVTTTTIYAKLTNNATSVNSGVISVTSTGASTKTLTVTTNTDNALSFDGVNDYVSLPSTLGSAYNNNAVTIEAWIKTSASSTLSRKDIVTFGSTSTSNNVMEFRMSNGKLQFLLNDGTLFYALTSTSDINTGKWVHVAAVKSGSSVSLYINGQLAASTPNGNVNASPSLNIANIGTLGYNTGSSYNLLSDSYFSGEIDQVRIWNTAKNGTDILANMTVEMTGNEANLLASYNFNQGIANGTNTVSSLLDNSVNTYNGTLNGFASTGTTSNFVVGFVPSISAAGNATIVSTGNTLQLSNGLTGGVWSSSNGSLASVNPATGLVLGIADGSVNIIYTICDKTLSYALTVVTPTITVSGTLKQFTSCSGCTVAPQSFVLSGTNLGSNISIAAPTGFEIATTFGGTYSSTINLVPTAGTVTNTTIYARLINNATTAVGGNFNITSAGATTRTVAATVNTDNALNFDGVDDFVNLGDVLDVTTLPYTSEAWVYWKGSSNAFTEIFTKDLVQSVAITNNNELHANFGNGTNWSSGLNSTSKIPLNKWTHVAVTRSSTGVVKMYINGVLDASTNTMNLTGDNNAVRGIGGKFVGTLNGPFSGAIDEIKVWNSERTAAEIASGLFTELAGNETNLLAYYNFNQGVASGSNTGITTLLDGSNNGYTGTLTNMAKTGTNSNFVNGFIPSIKTQDNALHFDGSNDKVTLPTSVINGLTNFTFETWVNPSIHSSLQRIFDAGVDGNKYLLFAIDNGKPFFAISNNGYPTIASSTSIPLNTWTHLAIVLNDASDVATIYINGRADVTGSMTKNPSQIGNMSSANLGNSSIYPGQLFNGKMDEVRFWNTARSVSELTTNFLNKLEGNETGLVAYYDMNQGISGGTNTGITTLFDKTTSAKNGTLNNFALTSGVTSNFIENQLPYTIAEGTTTAISSGANLTLNNELTGGVWSSSNINIATVNATSGIVTGVAAGSVTITYTICGKSTGYALNIIAPTITTTGTLPVIASCSGCSVNPNSFTVSGINLANNIIVTAPTGVVISTTSNGVYTNTITLTQSAGSVASTSVFVKLTNNAIANNSGLINITSTGAVSKTMSVTVNTDNALNFDGVNDYVVLDNVGTNSSLSFAGTSNFTLEAWVNRKATGADAAIVSKFNGGVAGNYWLLIGSNGKPYFSREAAPWTVPASNVLPENEWHHIAGVFDGSTMKIYIDGILDNSVAASGSISSSVSSIKVFIGASSQNSLPSTFFKGSLDEIRIWNVARTASEIQNNYLKELAGNETGLAAYYTFNQGIVNGTNTSITTLIDKGNNNIVGSLTNIARTGTTSNFIPGLIPNITGTATANVGATSTLSNTLIGGTWSSTNTAIATVNSTTGVVTGVAAGSVTITYTICEKTVSTVYVVTVPTITTNFSLTAFSTCATTNSLAQTFTVSAQNLTSNLVLTAPAGYELATSSGGTYSATIAIAPTSGSVSARLIYVRTTNAIVNGQSGNIVITSTGATTKNIATGNATVTRIVAASVTISSNAINNTICAGTSILFTATPTNGGNAPTYQWKLNGNNISGANSATYSTTTLTNNDVISVLMGSSLSSCVTGSPASSNSITTTVTSIPATPGNINGSAIICMNSNQVYNIAAVNGATTYTWVVTGDLIATPFTTNVLNITSSNNAGSGTIKVLAFNTCGSSAYSAIFNVTVSNQPAPTANFTVSASNVCLTNAGITFTNTSVRNATTNSPIGIYSWTFGDGNFATTVSTSNTYSTAGNFDAILTIEDANQCSSSISRRIVVDPLSVAGTVSVLNTTICEGTNTVLTLSGNTGTIQWQVSTDGINFANINGATTGTYTTPSLTATRYYQAVVTSGACSSSTSGVVTVTVSPTPAITLSPVANVFTTATSFDLAYNNTIGSPDEYSITTVAPNSLPNFSAITNFGLLASPVAVSIPTSSIGTYNFNLTVRNGNLGCASSVIPFSVTVVPAPPAGLIYNTPNVYTVGNGITALNPSSTGGAISSYSISPNLPAGLTINSTTGVISGTPSAVSTQTSYTVTGTNASGTVTATVVITVNVTAPVSLSYTTPNVYTTGTAITALNPSSTGGMINQYSIGPSLPAGLTIDANTGIISGTPSAVSSQTSYTVTGSNVSGTVTATVVITVNSGVVPQPQASLNAVDYGLLSRDTVKLKLNVSNGTAPYTLILSNSINTIKDTITNLTPVNNAVEFLQKRLDTTKVFTIFKLIDANNNTRTSGFTKDTTIVRLLKPQILLTLKADPAVKQEDNSFKTRLILKIKNAGQLNLRNVQVNANLSTVFPSNITYILDSVRVLNGGLILNPNYNGAGSATSASSTDLISDASLNSSKASYAVLDGNYLFNAGTNMIQAEEAEVAFYVSIGATSRNVVLKLQFETAGDGVLVKNDGSTSAQETTSISDDGTNFAQHPAVTNQGLPLPTYVPLFPNESIGASLNVGSATPVTGGFQYHFTAKIKNYGNVNLDSIRIEYNFNKLYPSPDQASLVGTPIITRGNIVYNANSYDGYNDVYLYKYGGDLQVGDSATYEYDLKIRTNRAAYTWPSYFVVYGRSVNSGVIVNDTSMAGFNPDPNEDNIPIEQFLTGVTINYDRPAPPIVENKTYLFGSTKPANIGSLVKSKPTGTIPVWCDAKTAACSVIPPSTPTEIGRYIYALRSYDTTTLLYSEVLVYDTVIIKPPVPIVINKKYFIGNTSNPANVSNQVTGMSGSVLNYYKNATLQASIPTLGAVAGITRYTTSQTVKGIESDTVGFNVTMLDPMTMLHLQKLADEPRLQSNSTFNITYTFIVTNRTDESMSNVLVVDNLQNTFPAPTSFDVVSVRATGGLLFNTAFNGKTDIQLIKSTSTLAASAIDTIILTVNLQPKGFKGTVNNLAVITATTPYGNLSINSSTTGFANETAKLPTPAVIPDLSIDIPEAFSPNRDGVNDRFVILKPFGTTLELEVYNRWGNVVYYNANYNNEWDGRGTNNFIGQDLMDGGYYYTLKAKSANGNSQIFKGFVLIQR